MIPIPDWIIDSLRMKTIKQLDDEIKALTAQREAALTAVSKSPKSLSETAHYIRLSHAGRQICDRDEMGGGYCGSVSRQGHLEQLCDPQSWVHSSIDRWVRAACASK